MIEASIITPLVLASNSSEVTFQKERNTRSATCCGWLSHNEGSPVYNITKPGYYDIDLDMTVNSATAGVVALGILEDDAVLQDTITAQTVVADGIANLSAHKTIRVCPNSNTQIEVGSVPSVITDTLGTSTDTQTPTLLSGTFTITRSNGC